MDIDSCKLIKGQRFLFQLKGKNNFCSLDSSGKENF